MRMRTYHDLALSKRVFYELLSLVTVLMFRLLLTLQRSVSDMSLERTRPNISNQLVTHKPPFRRGGSSTPKGLLMVIQAGGSVFFFFFQAEDGIRDLTVTGVQTCALPI